MVSEAIQYDSSAALQCEKVQAQAALRDSSVAARKREWRFNAAAMQALKSTIEKCRSGCVDALLNKRLL